MHIDSVLLAAVAGREGGAYCRQGKEEGVQRRLAGPVSRISLSVTVSIPALPKHASIHVGSVNGLVGVH